MAIVPAKLFVNTAGFKICAFTTEKCIEMWMDLYTIAYSIKGINVIRCVIIDEVFKPLFSKGDIQIC